MPAAQRDIRVEVGMGSAQAVRPSAAQRIECQAPRLRGIRHGGPTPPVPIPPDGWATRPRMVHDVPPKR